MVLWPVLQLAGQNVSQVTSFLANGKIFVFLCLALQWTLSAPKSHKLVQGTRIFRPPQQQERHTTKMVMPQRP